MRLCVLGRFGLLGVILAAAGSRADDELTATFPADWPPASTLPTTTEPTGQPLKPSQRPEAIERFVQYYLRMYGKHLASADALARTMAVIGLARIDEPRVTEKLLEVMRTDKAVIVRVYAWEALHARLDRLRAEQRGQWVQAAFELARINALRGDLRIGLVGAMAVEGPTLKNKRLFEALFFRTNSLDPGDIRTLRAMGDLLAQWRSADLIKGLIAAMGDIDHAYRAELILRRVHGGLPHSAGYQARGSRSMWAITQKHWVEWYEQAELKEIAPGDGECITRSRLMPSGEKITDTYEPTWRKDLELGDFRLDQLDVGFAIDSTGSMESAIRWLQRDVNKMMRAFKMISREPRIGVHLYRDYGDEYVVRVIPLSADPRRLAHALRYAEARGGGDIPEAVHAALRTLAMYQRWSASPSARKIIVLMGDAPPHEESLPKIQELVELGATKGYVFYTFKVRSRYRNVLKRVNYDPQLSTFDKIAAWGKGQSFWVDFEAERHRLRGRAGVAQPPSETAPDRVMLCEVLKAALAEGYGDRVEPLLNVLLQYAERPVPEKRNHFAPRRPDRPGRPREPRRPEKPRDPQAR